MSALDWGKLAEQFTQGSTHVNPTSKAKARTVKSKTKKVWTSDSQPPPPGQRPRSPTPLIEFGDRDELSPDTAARMNREDLEAAIVATTAPGAAQVIPAHSTTAQAPRLAVEAPALSDGKADKPTITRKKKKVQDAANRPAPPNPQPTVDKGKRKASANPDNQRPPKQVVRTISSSAGPSRVTAPFQNPDPRLPAGMDVSASCIRLFYYADRQDLLGRRNDRRHLCGCAYQRT